MKLSSDIPNFPRMLLPRSFSLPVQAHRGPAWGTTRTSLECTCQRPQLLLLRLPAISWTKEAAVNQKSALHQPARTTTHLSSPPSSSPAAAAPVAAAPSQPALPSCCRAPAPAPKLARTGQQTQQQDSNVGRQAWQVVTVDACYLTGGGICSTKHCLTHAIQTPPRVPYHKRAGTSAADASANLTHPLCVCQGTLQIVQLLQGLRASHQRLRVVPHSTPQHSMQHQGSRK